MKTKKLNWGILSTGRIAGIFAEGVQHSKTGQLAAVGSRSLAQSQKFAKKFGIARAYGSYQEILNDPQVDAVYIATPHPFHLEWVVKAAKAGKAILCEKPLGMKSAEVKRMIEAARTHQVFFMEAFMYRCHPQTKKLVQLIRSGMIGEVRTIQTAFCFNAPFDPNHRLFNPRLGGGGILDVGCYTASFSRLVAGAGSGKPFLDPIEVKGMVHRAKNGVDVWAAALLKFPGDILAKIACGLQVEMSVTAQVGGTKGILSVPAPWFAGWKAGKSKILFQKNWNSPPQTIWVKSDRSLYSYEADEVGECLRKGLKQSPAMPWADSLGNARVLDAWGRG